MDSLHSPRKSPSPPSRERTRLLIAVAGGPQVVARMFDPPISSQAVSQWPRVPAARCPVIERATQGRVTRHELRPDVYGPAARKREAA
jgi:DNA-binding transcriptional regulator YdaS (Cro superfamily)